MGNPLQAVPAALAVILTVLHHPHHLHQAQIHHHHHHLGHHHHHLLLPHHLLHQVTPVMLALQNRTQRREKGQKRKLRSRKRNLHEIAAGKYIIY